MRDRFAAKYQGQRFSFGYPACPNLEDQEKLFATLKPEQIGVQLNRRLYDGARSKCIGDCVRTP